MKLIGLMHAKNEQWVLRLSLPAALRLVDEIVVLDHDSTDATPEIIDEAVRDHPGRVHRASWTGEHYNEMAIRQATLERARAACATHMFWIDADEVLTANLIMPVREHIRALEPGESVELPWLAMWGSPDRYREDASVWTNNFKAFAFADHPEIRYAAQHDGYDMHQQTPRGLQSKPLRPFPDQSQGGVMHLQFANRRRLLAKHAWYKMSEAVRFPGRKPNAEIDAMYNQAMCEDGLALKTTPNDWWRLYEQERSAIDLDDAPWHEREVLRFWIEHGPELFEGLELWGLPERLIAHAEVA